MTPLQQEPSAQAPWTRRMLGRGRIAGAPSAGVPDASGTVSIPPRGTLDRKAPSGHRVPVPFLPASSELAEPDVADVDRHHDQARQRVPLGIAAEGPSNGRQADAVRVGDVVDVL